MSDDLRFGVRIEATGGQQAAAQFDQLRDSTSKLNAETSKLNEQARNVGQSLGAAGREAMQGDFGRVPGHLLNAAQAAELSAGQIAKLTLAVGLGAGAAIALGKAYSQGATETREMNKALQVTSNYVGMTSATMLDLGRAVSDASTLTVNASKQIVTQLVASGQIGAQSIAAVAKLADDYASATGRDVSKIAPELVKLFDDPAKGAAELNRQMHFLSPTEIEHIAHLQRIGELDAAQLELAEKLAAQIPKHADNLGLLEGAWNSLKKAASNAWDAMLDIGRPQTLEQKVTDAYYQVEALKTRRFASPAQLAAATGNLDNLRSQLDAQNGQVASQSAAAAANQTQNQAATLINTVSEYQKIADLRDKIVLAGRLDAQTDEQKLNKARAIFDLNNQIEAIQRGIGAENRQLTEAQITGALSLYEIQSKGTLDNIETQAKLGNITKQEADRQRTAFELNINEEKQLANSRLQSITGLTKLERERLQLESQRLAAEANNIRERGDNRDIIERSQLLAAQAAYDAAAMQATTARQLDYLKNIDAEIERTRIHNEEIGKTKAQVDMLRAAEQDRAIAAIEYDRATALADGAGEDSPYIQRLDAEIAKLKELQGLLKTGAGLEASDAANKKFQADFKRTEDSIDRGLTDALMRGFENGKSFSYNFRDSLVNMFKTMILKPVVEFALRPVSAGFASVLGGGGLSGAASAASGSGGALGGLSNLSSLGNLFGGGQTMADFGNFFGSIGATTEAGGTFGLMDALGGFAMANPVTAGLGILGAIALSSKLFGGGPGYAQNTGSDVYGSINQAGISGAAYSNSSNGQDNYHWYAGSLTPMLGGELGGVNQSINAMYKQIATIGKSLGVDTSGLSSMSANFSISGVMQGGNRTLMQGITEALGQASDSLVDQLVPSMKQFQQQGESLTQTFLRLGAAAQQAATSDALNKMASVLKLQDATASLFTGDLSPLTNQQKLDLLQKNYSTTLTAAQGGDQNAIGSLSGVSQQYLTQARGFYASSSAYTGIFNQVQGDVGNLVADTLTEQSMRFADMGVSLDQIAANTQNLDKRIADAIAAALAAQGTASDAIVKAQTEAVVRAILNANNPVTLA